MTDIINIQTLCWFSGILGAGFFAINLLPQIWKCYKTKSTTDISNVFLAFAFGGNIFSCIFVFYTNYQTGLWQYPIYFNYGIATILTFILTILKIKYDSGIACKRKSIDSIDDKIIELLKKRMEIAVEIGKEKKKQGLPIQDPKRELDILCKIPLNEPYSDNIESIYYKILEETRKIEKEDE